MRPPKITASANAASTICAGSVTCVSVQLGKAVLSGVWNTLQLTVYAMVIGVVLGIVLSVMRLSPNPVFRWVAWVFLPAGVGVIAALVVGTRVFPGVMFGSFLWNLSGHPMPLIDNLLLSLAGARLPT